MQTETQKYNGWTNYETWNVKLWMDNDGCVEQFTGRGLDAYELAKDIQDWHEFNMPDIGNNTYADMLNASLREVNWVEIAQSIIDEEE